MLGRGRDGGVGVSCPHNPLDPTLVGRGTVPLGVWLGLAEFGGVLKELPLWAREGLPLPLVHFLPATQSLSLSKAPRGALDSCRSITRPQGWQQNGLCLGPGVARRCVPMRAGPEEVQEG